jgi:hypothetical protein
MIAAYYKKMRFGGHAAQKRIILRSFSCGAMVLMAATAAHASDAPVVARRVTNRLLSTPRPAAETVTSSNPGPFVRGTVGIEFGLGFLDEAWNLNGSREALVDGSVSVWWAFLSRTALVVDFHATRVFQQPSRNAFVIGVTPGVRFQIVRREPWDLFGEIGMGPSWSDTSVPPRGTRFNYLGHTGIGLSRRLGRQVHGIASFRWLHLSNNGHEGHDRNPDIQALGGYAAVTVGF